MLGLLNEDIQDNCFVDLMSRLEADILKNEGIQIPKNMNETQFIEFIELFD